jgi:hypothetical protein
MAYELSKPLSRPASLEMSKSQLKTYFDRFVAAIPERGLVLRQELRLSRPWAANYSPKSLPALGDWFGKSISTRLRTPREKREIEARLRFPVEILDWDLSERGYSLAMDVGMYFGEVLRRNHRGSDWVLHLRKTNNFGQPVLSGFAVALNPIQLMVVLARQLAEGAVRGGRERLRALYEHWSELHRPA